jgi:hypothetical protein
MSKDLFTNVYSSGSWSKDGGGDPTPWLIGSSSPSHPSIASNGSGYAVSWVQVDGSNTSIYANVFDTGTWSQGGTLLEHSAGNADYPSIASNGSSYAVTWQQFDSGGPNSSIYANIYSNGTWSVDRTLLESSVNTALSPRIASNGSTYAVAWYQYDGNGPYSIYANIFSNGTWSTGGTLIERGSQYAHSPSIASDGSGYAVSWTQYDGTNYRVYANIYSANAWQTDGTLIQTDPIFAYTSMIVSNGNKYSICWMQQDPGDILVMDIWARLGL